MKRLSIIICVALLIATTVQAQRKSPKPVTPRSVDPAVVAALKPYKFEAEERLIYAVSWNNMKAAKVTLATEVEPIGRKVEVRVETVGVARELFRVVDRFTAYLNDSFLPVRAERDIQQGAKKESGEAIYHHEKRQVTMADESFPILPGTHDIASIFWALRSLDLKRGSARIEGFNTVEKRPFATTVELSRYEEVKTFKGRFRAIELIIRLQENAKTPPTDKYAIRMWLTDDERRLPVLITAKLPFGVVNMELIDSGIAQVEDADTKETREEERD